YSTTFRSTTRTVLCFLQPLRPGATARRSGTSYVRFTQHSSEAKRPSAMVGVTLHFRTKQKERDIMLKREAYAYYGVTQPNERNSWSACSEEYKRVVFTVYPFYVDLSKPVPMYVFHREYHNRSLSNAQKHAGLKWLVKHFRYAKEHCNGIVYCV